jgi:hypothetical protein
VFSRPNGEPWDVSELSRAFSRAAVRLTGKKTNPHLVRDMVITHVRGEGIASDAELEALSLYMGHSIAMQKGTYDRRTSAQKVAPAIGLMSAINARAAGGFGGGVWWGEEAVVGRGRVFRAFRENARGVLSLVKRQT